MKHILEASGGMEERTTSDADKSISMDEWMAASLLKVRASLESDLERSNIITTEDLGEQGFCIFQCFSWLKKKKKAAKQNDQKPSCYNMSYIKPNGFGRIPWSVTEQVAY